MAFIAVMSYAQDTTKVYSIDSVSVVSFYRNTVNVGSLVGHDELVSVNYGQEPSHIFAKMPGIYSMGDNGTDFGYGYFRVRGLDQTRINVTLDGMPWNESEDYGLYFANSPDLMSSIHTVKVERGTSSTNNGTASSGGSVNLESIDLLRDTESYGYVGLGSFNTYKTSVVYNSGLFGKSALHVKGTQQQTDGYKDWSGNNSQALTLKYGYYFNQKHSIDFLTLNGRHRNGQAWIGSTLDELAMNPRANGNTEAEGDDWFQTINKIQYKGWFNENILFTASTYLQYQTGWYNMDLDNYMLRFEDPDWYDTGIVYTYGLQHYLYGGNVAAKFYIGDLKLTTGANVYGYQREHYMDDRLSRHFSNIDPSEYYGNTGYKTDANVFASAAYKLGKFNFGANVQYRYVDFTYKDHLEDVAYDKNGLGTVWNFVNYGLNAEYNIDNTNKLYVRYSEVSREPTRSDMFGGNEFFPGELTTNKAERSYDVEAGYVVMADNLELNVNAYYMGFRNERVLNGLYGLNGLPMHETADRSYRTGLELSMDWNIWNGIHWALNTSVSENRVTSESFDNKYHILTPPVTLNTDIYYKKSGIRAGVNQMYHSKMYMDQENEFEIPEYLTFNVYGSYRFGNTEVGLRVNNILNRANYYNAAIGINTMWFRESGTNFFADLKFYF